MSGRTSSQALHHYLEPLQQAISCISGAVLVHGVEHNTTTVFWLRLSETPAAVRGPVPLSFALRQQLSAVPHPEFRTRWAVSVISYSYTLFEADQRELFAYHWHPSGRSSVGFPHLHFGRGVERGAGRVAKAHFPTGAIALQDVLRLIITDFGVRPLREDWSNVLDTSRDAALGA